MATQIFNIKTVEKIVVKDPGEAKGKHRLEFVFNIGDVRLTIGDNAMVNFTKVGQFVEFSITILDGKGRPAQIDGDISVTNSNEIAGGVFFDQVTRTGKLTCLDEGIGQVVFQCDADLGGGVKPLAGTLDFTGPNLTEASVFTVTVGEIQEPA